jgi:hypothetical protein
VVDYGTKSLEEWMRSYCLLLAALIASPIAYAASDPFVGTWVYSQEKSPTPTIRYKIKDLGGDRYALTGSGGDTTEIKADGVFIKGPQGEKVSFKKLDDHNWQMIRFDPDKMVRTFTVSEDDKTLTLKDVFTLPEGKERKTLFEYARLSPSTSIFGEWQSFSMKEESTSGPEQVIIEPYGKDGLRIFSSPEKRRLEMNFDGKLYAETGPDAEKGSMISGERVSSHLLRSKSQVNGNPDDEEEWKVSDDGKTMTIIAKPVKSSAIFTSVFDRK